MNNTASIMAIASVMFISSLTTTLSTPYNEDTKVYCIQQNQQDYKTETISAFEIKPSKSNYEEAISIFCGEMREFTPSELEQYNNAVCKLYKPTGLNIFEIC